MAPLNDVPAAPAPTYDVNVLRPAGREGSPCAAVGETPGATDRSLRFPRAFTES